MDKLTPIEKSFQSDEVLIHRLFNELRQLFLDILLLCVRENCINTKKPWKTDFKSDENKLPAYELIIGDDARAAVRDLSKVNQIIFYVDVVRPFYETLLEKLLKHLPFGNKILQHLRFVDPSTIQSKKFTNNVLSFAKMLPDSVFPAGHVDDLTAEVRSLRLMASTDTTKTEMTVQDVWKKILPGDESKFPLFRQTLAAALCLPHGNAVTERQFSIMTDILTKKRSQLHDETLHALLFVKSALSQYGDISNVPITRQLKLSCRNAHAKSVEAEKKKKLDREQDQFRKTKMAIEQAMKSTVANDPQINDLDGKRISASAALIEEKKKIDAKDKLINELMLAREKDKERYEMVMKEKERVDRLVSNRKERLMSSYISTTASRCAGASCDLDDE